MSEEKVIKKAIKYLRDFDVYEKYPIGFLTKISHEERMEIEYTIRMLLVDKKAKEVSEKFNISFDEARDYVYKGSCMYVEDNLRKRNKIMYG